MNSIISINERKQQISWNKLIFVRLANIKKRIKFNAKIGLITVNSQMVSCSNVYNYFGL